MSSSAELAAAARLLAAVAEAGATVAGVGMTPGECKAAGGRPGLTPPMPEPWLPEAHEAEGVAVVGVGSAAMSGVGVSGAAMGGKLVGIQADPNAKSCDIRSMGGVGTEHQEGGT